MKKLLGNLDTFQQRHRVVALPVATFKRFGEHGGGRLASTVSYWSFFSIFPLMLAFVTVLNIVLEDRPDTRQRLLDGALGQVLRDYLVAIWRAGQVRQQAPPVQRADHVRLAACAGQVG